MIDVDVTKHVEMSDSDDPSSLNCNQMTTKELKSITLAR